MALVYEYRLINEDRWRLMPKESVIKPLRDVFKAGATRVVFQSVEWQRRKV